MTKAKSTHTSTRKRTEAGTHADAASTPSQSQQLGQLYTAHQVHTLAQILMQRLTGYAHPHPHHPHHQMMSFVGNPAGMPIVGNACTPTWAAPGPNAPGMGFAPGFPPALVYWYP
jgi:hypothetical protein